MAASMINRMSPKFINKTRYFGHKTLLIFRLSSSSASGEYGEKSVNTNREDRRSNRRPSSRNQIRNRLPNVKPAISPFELSDGDIFDAETLMRKTSSEQPVSQAKSAWNSSNDKSSDFFGIQEYDNDNKQSFTKRSSEEGFLEEFDLKPKIGRSYEMVHDTTYGVLRLDSDNAPLSRKTKKKETVNIHLAAKTQDSDNRISDELNRNSNFSRSLENERIVESDDGLNYFDQFFTNVSQALHKGRPKEDNVSTDNSNKFGSSNLIEDQYFGDNQSTYQPEFTQISGKDISDEPQTKNDGTKDIHSSGNEKVTTDSNIFDAQYFESQTNSEFTSKNEASSDKVFKISQHGLKKDNNALSGSDFIDDQYFSQKLSTNIPLEHDVVSTRLNNVIPENDVKDVKPESPEHVVPSAVEKDRDEADEFGANLNEYVDPVTKFEQRQSRQIKFDAENPKTAYDMAMKIRREKQFKGQKKTEEQNREEDKEPKVKFSGLIDSQGFRILKDQVLDLSHMTEEVIVNILKNSVLYNRDGILAINKPYGLACHSGPGIKNSVKGLLPLLARRLEKQDDVAAPYHLVHRLDQDTTGVLIIAKNAGVAWKLRDMFKRREVTKIYWAITKGVPQPPEGVINIPITEGHVDHKYRMVLRPDYTEETRQVMKKSSQDVFEAITNFKVLDCKGNAALVEMQPETGVKHQLRCHMAFAMNTPILGDHKYSHYGKIAPQRLHPDMLIRLGIRQSKVRHVPMHLHAKTVVLPEFRDGRNLFISAHIPKHFKLNMKRLKLNEP